MTTRKRTVVASSLLVLLVGSIGVACGSDTAEMPAIPDGSAPTSTTPPPPPPVEAGGDAADAGELVGLPPPPPAKQDEVTDDFGIFVSKGAAAGGDGTRAKPFTTISEGLDKAETVKKRLYVCAGTYPEAVILRNGVSIIGNLKCVDPSKWEISEARTTVVSPTSPAVTAQAIATATRVDGLEVIAPAGTETEPSSIALLAVDSPGLTMTLGKLEAGAGRNGTDGISPTPFSQVLVSPVQGAAAPAECFRNNTNVRCSETSYSQRGGQPGGRIQCYQGVASGPLSSGGYGGSSTVFRPNSNAAIVFGTAGLDGTPGGGPGVPGSSSAGGEFSATGFVRGDGVKGTDGSLGQAGKGGTPNVLSEPGPALSGVTWGWNGGGGAGGCAGLAGTAGTGGGASTAALLVRSPVRFEKMTLRSMKGGNGGRGTFSTPPTSGQPAADPPSAMCFPCAAAGQPGRPAGISGHGAGGPSVAIANDANAKAVVVDSQLFHDTAGTSPAAMSEGGATIPAATPAAAADILAL